MTTDTPSTEPAAPVAVALVRDLMFVGRITATARHPGGGADNVVGAGVVDPVAALTWDVPPGPATIPYQIKAIPPPVYVPPPDRSPITWVVIVGVGVAAALGIGAMARRALRRR